ncbi:tRNA (adenosine(37)-N6)-dimethylallyltransferase MiaA [Patescibacteria group bacterium]|nr:tRNA (adenosine(37)-N6)-dimethylallyltransferase MiaA [Patescibacteria group bacterium]
MKNLPKIIAIVGPTASGKTGLALEIAKKFNGEIIAVDSRTLYKGMDIGTAKPEGTIDPSTGMYIYGGIPHWGIDILDIDEEFSVADFKTFAEEKIKDILSRNKLPILVGGTGLYFSAIIDDLSFTSVLPNKGLREKISKMTKQEIIKRINELDSEAFENVDFENPRRLQRALEILEISGKKLSEQKIKGAGNYHVLQLAFDIEKTELYSRINKRVDEMIVAGLTNEVKKIKEQFGEECNAMTGIGYRQICSFLNGDVPLSDAIELIKRDTRRYAKRQLTWFKKDVRVRWIKTVDEGIEKVQVFI